MSKVVPLLLLLLALIACGDEPAQDPAEPLECSGLSEAACEASPDCGSLRGLLLTAEGCLSGEYAGCTEMDVCGDAITYARDSNDACWEFPNTCQPENWQPTAGLPDDCQDQITNASTCE